jgi:hypothetical protein
MNGLTVGFGFFHSPFDKLRANGKILNLMAVMLQRGNSSGNAPALRGAKHQQYHS